MAGKKSEKIVIGYKEKIDIPEMHVYDIEAKIDTGAYSVALHCHDYWVEIKNNEKNLCFHILDPEHESYSKKVFCFNKFTMKNVKSSSGETEKRFVIQTAIVLGGKKIFTDVSLTDRGSMRYPVLIGRKFLRKGFIVDVSRVYVTKNNIKKREIK